MPLAKRIARLTNDAEPLREWLATHHTDRCGPTGRLRKSNRTDNESAKTAKDKGVIQGYTEVAAVDAKHRSYHDRSVGTMSFKVRSVINVDPVCGRDVTRDQAVRESAG